MSTALAAQALAPAVDIIVDSPAWAAEPGAETIVRRAINEAAIAVPPHGESEVAVALTDDAAIRTLNAQWRGLDKPTNVLSFPAPAFLQGDAPVHLGDIAIAYETTAREAREEGKPFAHHLSHLAVHGFLHLLGYDHERDRGEMRRVEERLRRRAGLTVGLIARSRMSSRR